MMQLSSLFFPHATETDYLPHIEDTTSRKQVDVLQAQELNQLSKNEREQVLFELHGVSDLIQEEPSFVERKLVELDEALAKVSQDTAYGQAALSSPEYVQKTEFRLMFLRGDAFDVENAVARMIATFESKLELFGAERLTKDITLQDLDEGDLNCLKTGSVQTLPIRDKSGRAIICMMPALLGKDHRFTLQNRMRAVWYVYNAMIEDIEVQKRGFVFVFYGVGSGMFNREAALKIPKLTTALPVRAVGIHVCFDSPRWRILTHLGMLVGGQRSRTHLRIHFGNHVEVQYKLATFGVLFIGDIFPIGPDGEPRIDNFLEMFQLWQKRDENFLETGLKQETNIIPGPKDVLLGRQKLAQEHTGNLRFRFTVETFREVYENNTTRMEKTEIANKIVSLIKENKGRFLKMDTSGWVEVDDVKAREKVSHTFRNRRSATAAATKASEPSQNKIPTRQPSKVRRNIEDGSATQEPSCVRRNLEDGSMYIMSSKTDGHVDSKRLRIIPQEFF